MNRKLTIVLLSVLMLSTASALPPRGQSGPESGPGHGPAGPLGPPDLAALLNLEGEQLAKVDALSEQQHLALLRLHREQRRAEQALQTKFRDELANILSVAQLNRLEQWRAERRPPPGSRRMGPMQPCPQEQSPMTKREAPQQP